MDRLRKPPIRSLVYKFCFIQHRRSKKKNRIGNNFCAENVKIDLMTWTRFLYEVISSNCDLLHLKMTKINFSTTQRNLYSRDYEITQLDSRRIRHIRQKSNEVVIVKLMSDVAESHYQWLSALSTVLVDLSLLLFFNVHFVWHMTASHKISASTQPLSRLRYEINILT